MWSRIVVFTLALGVLALLYRLFLSRRNSFGFNRFFLWISLFGCLALPFVPASFSINLGKDSKGFVQQLTPKPGKTEKNETHELTAQKPVKESQTLETSNSGMSGMLWLYWGVSGVLVFRFIINLLLLIRQTFKKFDGYLWGMTLHWIEGGKQVYSFFNHLFVSKKDYEREGIPTDILRHEKAHARQWHTLDLLMMEFLCCMLWFNPFIWFYRKWLKENHEFMADYLACKESSSVVEYMSLLVNTHKKRKTSFLLNAFQTSSLTFKRIHMLTKKNPSHQFFKLGIITVFAIALFLVMSSFVGNHDEKFVVLIDPGHGGKDSGFHYGDYTEAAVNLEIAQYIEHLANKEGKIKVMLTRQDDSFLSLWKRVEVSEKMKPNLLFGLHGADTRLNTVDGALVFYSKKLSRQISSQALAQKWSTSFENHAQLKNELKPASFLLLRESTVPAFSINLVNSEDADGKLVFDTEEGRKKIGEKVYKALVQVSAETR